MLAGTVGMDTVITTRPPLVNRLEGMTIRANRFPGQGFAVMGDANLPLASMT